MKVAVVTPTVGCSFLEQCLNSVQQQTYENLTHYVFFDGEENYDKIHTQIYQTCGTRTVKTIKIEDNVGKDWLGHRVYAACSFLVNADIICYLDEDNWIDPDHISSLVDKIKDGYDWAYSLRKIYTKDGEYLFEDNCESLGKWPVYFNGNAYHIDTSCFAIKTDVATKVGHAWYDKARPKAADRQFFHVLKTYFPNYACSTKYSLNYRLGGNVNSVQKEFFEKGNDVMKSRYGNESYPWIKTNTINYTAGPRITIIE
jgi:glycosyltransferase involved in cell wall biosynthesis